MRESWPELRDHAGGYTNYDRSCAILGWCCTKCGWSCAIQCDVARIMTGAARLWADVARNVVGAARPGLMLHKLWLELRDPV